MASFTLIYAPRAERDLLGLPRRIAAQILDDLEQLLTEPWPHNQTKKLKGVSFWEIKTGDYRSLFLREGRQLIVLRIVNRKDLERTVRRLDTRYLV